MHQHALPALSSTASHLAASLFAHPLPQPLALTPLPSPLPPRSVAWDEEAVQTFRRESLRVLAVTWNVGESKPEPGSPFFRWVHEAAFPTQLVVVGLQEIEMGSSSGRWGVWGGGPCAGVRVEGKGVKVAGWGYRLLCGFGGTGQMCVRWSRATLLIVRSPSLPLHAL